MENPTGDKYCTMCGDWIGNYFTGFTPNGEKSFHGIIRLKYCDKCRPKAKYYQAKERGKKFRMNNSRVRKQEKTKLELLEQENELLRKKIVQLRNEEG